MESNDRQLAAQQIVEIVPLVMRTLAAELRHTGHTLSPSHFRLLAMLQHREWSLGDLAAHEKVSSPTISRSISTLEERGGVQRRPSDEDRRVVLARLTSDGEQVLLQMEKMALLRIVEMLSPLNHEDMLRLNGGLPVLRKVFEMGLSGAGDEEACE